MSFKWFDLIVLFGIMQGLISIAVLICRKSGELHKKLLIVIILVLCLLSFKIEIHTLDLWNKSFFRYFPLGIDLLIQPLLFLYVSSLTRQNYQFTAKSLIHFLPPAIFFVHSVMVYLAVMPLNELGHKDAVAENWHFNQVKIIEDLLSAASTLIYGCLCFISVKNYQYWLYKFTSDTRYPTLNWLYSLLISSAILGLGLLINILIDNTAFGLPSFHRWQFFYIYLTFLIYYLGIKGLTFRTENLPAVRPSIVETEDRRQKYEYTELEIARAKIQRVMVQNKVFLDNELTLQKMSYLAEINPGLASAAINQLWGKTFRSMVNEYRVAEVKLKLLDPRHQHLSLLGIALECGFNSEASFYRIFKAEVGCSPKEFISSKRHFTN